MHFQKEFLKKSKGSDLLKIKGFVSVLMFFVLLNGAACLDVSANELADGLFTYSVFGDYACITSCTDIHKHRLIIPEKMGNYTVKEISSGAFYGNGYLTEILIPEGVEIIGDYAFYMCEKLRFVTLPDTLAEIGENAFGECSAAEEILLPDKVEKIGKNAFSGCGRIIVSKENKRFSSDENGVLFNKYASVLLQYPSNSGLSEYTVPSSVRIIENRAFYKAKMLRKITFSKGLTCIGDEAFSESGIEEITLPDSVKKVGKSAFSHCPLKTAVLSDSMTEIPEQLFQSCGLIERIELTDGIREIGEKAFFGCDSLSDFVIPDSVEIIGSGAFFGCVNLRDASVPEGVESIPDNAFYRTGLRSVTFPRSIKSIGYEAFAYCDSLKKIVFNGSKEDFKEIFIDRNNEAIEKCEKVFKKSDGGFYIRKPSSVTLGYGDTLVLYANTEGNVEWKENGGFVNIKKGDGGECYVTPRKSGKTVISAHFTDGNGETRVSEIGIKVKVNVFRKAVSYLKDLFGLTRYVF